MPSASELERIDQENAASPHQEGSVTVEVTAETMKRLERFISERYGEGASRAWPHDEAEDLLSDVFLTPPPQPVG